MLQYAAPHTLLVNGELKLTGQKISAEKVSTRIVTWNIIRS